MELIDKNKVLDEIQRMVLSISKADVNGELASIYGGQQYILMKIFGFVDNLEVKEVDLEQEKDEYWNKLCDSEFGELLERDAKWFDDIAKYFFELGLKVNNPTTAADRGMAEEIIINLKRIEQDYCINLTKEMQWLRDIVKKGE